MSTGVSRREFVALMGAGLAAASTGARSQSSRRLFAYVGSWTQGPFGVGGGGGISVFAVDRNDGSLAPVGRTGPEFDNLNAGYLCISPNGRYLYSTNEVKNLHGEFGAGGGVLAFTVNGDGSISHLNTQPSMGVNPAYLTIDATGSFILAANHGNYDPVVTIVRRNGAPEIEKVYDDGTVSMLPVEADGTVAPASDVAVLERLGGVDPVSQQSAHAHSVNVDPSNRFALVCDKGADRIYVFEVDWESGRFGRRSYIATAPGISPRHSAFHPRLPYVFIVHERESSLASYRFDAATGALTLIQTVPTIPPGFDERNAPADVQVHPNGRFVYASNRGHDSVAVFAIEETTGRVSLVEIGSVQGAAPRGIRFAPSGRFFYAANQGSDNVVTFAVDPDRGTLSATGAEAEVLKPACVRFLEV